MSSSAHSTFKQAQPRVGVSSCPATGIGAEAGAAECAEMCTSCSRSSKLHFPPVLVRLRTRAEAAVLSTNVGGPTITTGSAYVPSSCGAGGGDVQL